MNENLLKTGVQAFINKNLNTDIMSVLLKNSPFEEISPKELAQQIESKKKCKTKLPSWHTTSLIYYPKKLNIEQSSSEITAAYKAEIISGESLIDLCGGFGVDSYAFSKKFNTVLHAEIDKELSEIATYNFKILGVDNIQTYNTNGIDLLQKSKLRFDWIYIDPSRRDDTKRKVFMLSDCIPDVAKELELIFSKTNNVLVKTSPLLDITAGLRELHSVNQIHIIAVNNEVKELLWVLQKDYSAAVEVKTIHITKAIRQSFNFQLLEEKKAHLSLSVPLNYLFEPNAAIMKSGAFRTIGNRCSIKKLHEHTHLYTSEQHIEFPGRCFQILQIIPYNKKNVKRLNITQANISIRNFPESVADIRKKLKIKEGGNMYLFFITDSSNSFIILQCVKC